MIFINPNRIRPPADWILQANELSRQLRRLPVAQRAEFIDEHRDETWGHQALVDALRRVVGEKCWYSEVPLAGADPNVDHFRPKGRVVEIENDTQAKTGAISQGYSWLAFELRNFRLSCMHANQRRVDVDTDGGKADFFPVVGARAALDTDWDMIRETVLPLDPCSFTDMSLMWFDPTGTPGYANWLRKPTPLEERRMKATIWLYHLNKSTTAKPRAEAVAAIWADMKTADTSYKLWNPRSDAPDEISRGQFDALVAKIRNDIADDAPFAGAKRCAVRIAQSEYPWIQEYGIV